MDVHAQFDVDHEKTFSPYIADLLNDGFPVLIYAGDKDFTCVRLLGKSSVDPATRMEARR